MKNEYPMLPVASLVLEVIGGIVILAGLYYFVYEGLIEPFQQGHRFTSGDKLDLIIGGALILIGLIGFVVGETSKVVLAIREKR